jgi:hypothetical protein
LIGLRPAPSRFPPQVKRMGKGSWTVRAIFD